MKILTKINLGKALAKMVLAGAVILGAGVMAAPSAANAETYTFKAALKLTNVQQIFLDQFKNVYLNCLVYRGTGSQGETLGSAASSKVALGDTASNYPASVRMGILTAVVQSRAPAKSYKCVLVGDQKNRGGKSNIGINIGVDKTTSVIAKLGAL